MTAIAQTDATKVVVLQPRAIQLSLSGELHPAPREQATDETRPWVSPQLKDCLKGSFSGPVLQLAQKTLKPNKSPRATASALFDRHDGTAVPVISPFMATLQPTQGAVPSPTPVVMATARFGPRPGAIGVFVA